MFELERLVIVFLGSIIAAFWDIKTTNIPDAIVILMILSAVIFGVAEGIMTESYSSLFLSLFTGGIFLAVGVIMYIAGQWGGGDGGLLVGIGMLMSYINKDLFSFPVNFLSNIVLIGAVYSLAYVLFLASKNKAILKGFSKDLKGNSKILSLASGILVTFSIVFYLTASSQVFIPIVLLLLIFFYVFAKRADSSFYRRISTKELKIGDMIGEDIPQLKIYKKYIKGLTPIEVKKIRKLKRFVRIREGVRFGPVFPLSLLFTLLYGNMLFLLFL